MWTLAPISTLVFVHSFWAGDKNNTCKFKETYDDFPIPGKIFQQPFP